MLLCLFPHDTANAGLVTPRPLKTPHHSTADAGLVTPMPSKYDCMNSYSATATSAISAATWNAWNPNPRMKSRNAQMHLH
eukprot:7865560-Lingulodinium_polyedra.AAC.1